MAIAGPQKYKESDISDIESQMQIGNKAKHFRQTKIEKTGERETERERKRDRDRGRQRQRERENKTKHLIKVNLLLRC